MRRLRRQLSSKPKHNGYKTACETCQIDMPLVERRGYSRNIGGLTRSDSRESYSQALDVLTTMAVLALMSTVGRGTTTTCMFRELRDWPRNAFSRESSQQTKVRK